MAKTQPLKLGTIVEKRVRRDTSRINWIDFGLMSLGSCLAVYSAAASIGQPDIGWFFVRLVLGGALVSYAIRLALSKSRLLVLDGPVYGLAVASAFAFVGSLNTILPGDGFPREVIAAGWLCWMLGLGSFATWRDSTLLFQAIPCVAIFGLVGCYDTFRDVTFAFFAFLICLATVFARAHGRNMLRQAVESGYFGRSDGLATGTVSPDQEERLFQQIKRGPWRWVAGPEWALGSALAIIALSMLGAPVIRDTVTEASDVLGIRALKPSLLSELKQKTTTDRTTSSMPIGRGPNDKLSDKPIFEVTIPGEHYWRTQEMDLYTGSAGWATSLHMPENELWQTAIQEIASPVTVPFTVRALEGSGRLPLPGEVSLTVSSEGNLMANLEAGTHAERVFSGEAVFDKSASPPQDAQTSFPWEAGRLVDTEKVPSSVTKFALDAAGGPNNSDYQKAVAIMKAIGSRAKYNLKARPVPSDRDPVEYFLFDSKEGYCDLFASAMVVSARSVGIPARFVLGYLPDPKERISDLQVIREKDYHAWAELYFRDHGWVIFDPTQLAEDVTDTAAAGVDPGAPFFRQPWFANLLNGFVGLTLVGAAAVIAQSALRKRKPKGQRTDVEKAYMAFVRLLEKKSQRRRQPSETPDEFLAAVNPFLNGNYEAAKRLNDLFVEALYSSKTLDGETVARLQSELRQLRKMIQQDKVQPARAVVHVEVPEPEAAGIR